MDRHQADRFGDTDYDPIERGFKSESQGKHQESTSLKVFFGKSIPN